MTINFPILSFLIFWPIFGAVVILIAGKAYDDKLAKTLAVVVSVIELIVCVPLYQNFDLGSYAMQFQEMLAWIPRYNINYSVGIDGISLALVILSSITTLIVVLGGCKLVHKFVSQYMAAFLVAQGMMVGVFASLDAVLFYVFWEGMLIPIYLSIGIWGGENRSYAAMKFFIYTFLGSVLMLVALLYLHGITGSFKITDFYDLHMSLKTEIWLFLAFFVAFAVKVPMWPFHTWLPDAHTEAPAGGSVVLAALMLKMGVYGFIRFSMPIVSVANQTFATPMIVLSLVAIVYIGILALAQTDMKKLIAYSSIAHMGISVLGCYMVYDIMAKTGDASHAFMSFEGAVVQMIAHAFSSGAMFLAVGVMYDKVHSRRIKDYGGVAKSMPILAAFFMLFAMSNVGLPGTSGFVGEFMVIVSAMQASFWVAALAATTVVIAAGYTLWMYKRVFFGKVVHQHVADLQDIGMFEIATFSVLAVGVLVLGLYPECLLRVLHASVGHLLTDSLHFDPIYRA
jgi:NADH-quinone oxidoreductase subunit M